MREMGANLKQMVSKNSNAEGDYYGTQFIRPKEHDKMYIARAVKEDGIHSYIIVLHFNEVIKNKLRDHETLSDEIVDQAMTEFTI